jgi:hypothetical protein
MLCEQSFSLIVDPLNIHVQRAYSGIPTKTLLSGHALGNNRFNAGISASAARFGAASR